MSRSGTTVRAATSSRIRPVGGSRSRCSVPGVVACSTSEVGPGCSRASFAGLAISSTHSTCRSRCYANAVRPVAECARTALHPGPPPGVAVRGRVVRCRDGHRCPGLPRGTSGWAHGDPSSSQDRWCGGTAGVERSVSHGSAAFVPASLVSAERPADRGPGIPAPPVSTETVPSGCPSGLSALGVVADRVGRVL